MSENLISEEVVEETTINDTELEGVETNQDSNEQIQEDETKDSEEEQEAKLDPLEEKMDKMQHGFEKRVGKLTKKYRNLEEENAQLKNQMQEQSKKVEAPKDRSDFETDEDWVDYRAEQKVRAILDKQSQEQKQFTEAEQRQKAVADSWNERVKEVTSFIPDYEDVIKSVDDDVVLPQNVAEVILESDVGVQLAYHLAKNPNEVEKMKGMNERQVDRFIARLEYKVENEYKPSSNPTDAITKAKPTPKPKGKGSGNSKANVSMEDYMAQRNKRLYGK